MRPRSRIADASPAAGTASDATVARAVGCRESEVWAYRKRHGIPPFCAQPAAVASGPDLPEWAGLLGSVPDREVARRSGVSYQEVRKLRLRLQIPRWTAKKPQASPRPPPPDPPYVSLLGTMSDAEIARRYGLTRARVHQHRAKRNIPAFRP